ncbi:MAG: hypothetical protein WC607_01710 [Candidatus Micrarchaeia archaeon]
MPKQIMQKSIERPAGECVRDVVGTFYKQYGERYQANLQGDRLHVVVNPEKFESLRAFLSLTLVSREHGFKLNTKNENALLFTRPTRRGFSRFLNLFSNNDFEIKLLRTPGLQVNNKPTSSVTLSLSAPKHHEISASHQKLFKVIFEGYALERRKN